MSVRLLIVDDTEHVRAMLVDILGFHGFEIVGATGDGDQAVELAATTDPDVVVMDFRLREADGLEVARRIREQRPHQQVILFSAYLDDDVEARAKDAGVAVCVPKSSGVEALAREISALVMDLG